MAGVSTATQGSSEPLQWRPQRAERTKARPKHTLYGTTLASHSKRELSDIEKIDVDAFNREVQAKVKDPSQPPIPDYLKSLAADRERVEESRSRLETMREAAMRADRERRAREMAALSIRGSNSAASPKGAVRQYPAFYTQDDLAHAKEMNRVGLNERGSYNYDKFGRRMPVHKYSGMGDILKPGNDLNASTSAEQLAETVALAAALPPRAGRGPVLGAPQGKTLMDFVDPGPLVTNIPPNIRHKYGTRVVESLLQDQAKVAEAMAMQRELSEGRQTLVKRRKNLPELPPSPCENYESLGTITRSNVFPGRNLNVNAGVVKATHNDEVYLRRVAPTDEFKFQRDHLSMWNEHHFLWAKMNRSWKEYLESMPKYQADWDRSAKRPPPAPAPLPAKVKAKPKPKPKPQAKENPAPEPVASPEFKFVTPPLTPPPPPPAPLPMPEKVERDDEFWNFYDQPK